MLMVSIRLIGLLGLKPLLVHDHIKKGDLQTLTYTKKIWTIISDDLFEQTQKDSMQSNLSPRFLDCEKYIKRFLTYSSY